MRRVTVIGLALVAALTAASSGTATEAATSRIVDRTFSCTIAPSAGGRTMQVGAVSGYRDPVSAPLWKWQPGAWALSRDTSLVLVTAGDVTERARRQRTPMLAIDPGRCRGTEAIPLSRRGLVGGPASQLQGSDTYDCRTTRVVLVRVRAVFRSPTTLTRQRYFGKMILASAPGAAIRDAQLAVRTTTGKPVVFADARESGRARLFTAPGCPAS